MYDENAGKMAWPATKCTWISATKCTWITYATPELSTRLLENKARPSVRDGLARSLIPDTSTSPPMKRDQVYVICPPSSDKVSRYFNGDGLLGGRKRQRDRPALHGRATVMQGHSPFILFDVG